jgi:hypothetical protein
MSELSSTIRMVSFRLQNRVEGSILLDESLELDMSDSETMPEMEADSACVAVVD